MKFRNYCVVVMGNTKDVILEITKVSETEPNMLDAKGIFIATFSSAAEPRELNDYFKLNNRSFFLFDLNPDYSGYHITKKEINDGLFGFLKLMNASELEDKSQDLINEINSSAMTKTNHLKQPNDPARKHKPVKEAIITEAEIAKMTKDEKEDMLNTLIEKGIETDYDKKLAQKLAR